MGFFSAKKTEITPQLLETPEQKSAKQLMSSYWEKYGANYNPTDVQSPYQAYPNQLSAAMPSEYGQISPIIQAYLNQGANANPLMGASQEQIMKTLQGGYDPYTSEYYKSFKRGVGQDTEEAQAALRQKAQAGGMYESLGRLMGEADVEGQGQDRLNTQLATMQQQERQNMLNVLPQAMQLGEYQEQLPQRQLSAISQYAGLSGQWQQAVLDKQYQEWVRQKTEQKYPQELASNFLQTYNPSYYYPQYETTTTGWQKAAGMVNPLYNDWMTAQGASMPGLSMADTAKLAAALASSITLKENIANVSNALEKVKKLQGVLFDWKKDKKKDGGVIAEDLEKVIPEAVTEIDGIKHIKPMMIIAYLIEAIKELSNKE